MAAEQTGSARRLLMLAYNFPPRDTGVSHHRPEALYRYLAEFGWQPRVITARRNGTAADVLQIEDRSIAAPDNSAGPGVKMMRRGNTALKTVGDGRLAPLVERAKRELRRLPSYRDDYIAFSRAVVPLAIEEGRRIGASAVWTSCNPFSLAPAAVEVARALGVPCLVDLRDPLFAHLRYGEDSQHWFYRALEQAAAVTICSPVCADDGLLSAITPRLPGLILSGLWHAPGSLPRTAGSRFCITHAGYMYRQQHFPELLCQGLKIFLAAKPQARLHTVLQFIGLDSSFVRDCPSYGEMAGSIELLPETPYAQVLEHLQQASALLLFHRTIDGEQRAGIRTKLYDYLAIGAPVMHLCDSPGITGELLRWSGGGESLKTAEEIAAALDRHYARWQQQRSAAERDGAQRALPITADPLALDWLGQRRMAGQFAEVLDAVLEGRSARSMEHPPWSVQATASGRAPAQR